MTFTLKRLEARDDGKTLAEFHNAEGGYLKLVVSGPVALSVGQAYTIAPAKEG